MSYPGGDDALDRAPVAHSPEKVQIVKETVDGIVNAGAKVTFAEVRRRTKFSNDFLYSPGVKEIIAGARGTTVGSSPFNDRPTRLTEQYLEDLASRIQWLSQMVKTQSRRIDQQGRTIAELQRTIRGHSHPEFRSRPRGGE